MPQQQLVAGWARERTTVAARIETFVTHPVLPAWVERFLIERSADTRQRNGWRSAETAKESTLYRMQR